MTRRHIRSHGEARGREEVNPVTGSATIQPGTFHEPGHEAEAARERSSGTFTGKAEEIAANAWSKVTTWMSHYPIAAFVVALGLGYVLGRERQSSVGFAHRLPRARADWRRY